jgi:positive regulator of sigma E activity
MGIAAVVYTVPLIAFIIGLAVAKALDYKDIYVLFSGIAGLAAGFVPAGIMNKKLLCKKNAFFNITRILQ